MSTLSSLREQLREKKKELKIYEKRYGQLEDILSDLSSHFTSDVEDINAFIDSLVDTSETGFEHLAHIVNLNSGVKANKEKNTHEDGPLSETKSNLDSDKSATSEKIETIKAEIASLERRIEEEEENERKETEKKIKEALDKLKDLI